MVAVRNQLLKDRKALSFVVNGQQLIPAPPVGPNGPNAGTVDARNGPQPQHCLVTELNSNTFVVQYKIVAHYWENDRVLLSGPGPAILSGLATSTPGTAGGGVLGTGAGAGAAGNTVLSNRWSESVEIDDCLLSTKTREGKIFIRSDNTAGFVADQTRLAMAVCGVPAGFLRQSARYKVDPSGLALEYRVVDREVFKKPPTPAFTAQGYFTETMPNGGAQRIGMVFVRLRGAKTTPQDALIKAAVTICTVKLAANGAAGLVFGGKQRGAPYDAMLRVDLYENEVQFQMSVLLQGQRARLEELPGFTGTAQTFTPLTDGTGPGAGAYNPGYLDRGTAGLLLQSAAYYDPSLSNVTLKYVTNPPATALNRVTPTDTYLSQMDLPDPVEPGQGGLGAEGN